MRLLVVGSDRVDAGKTTFTVGLLDHVDGVGVKPRAGNDYWFDHDDVREAVGEGRLYGKDARRIAAASRGDLAPEDVNPVHRLWQPSPGPDSGLLGQSRREFLVDRVGDGFLANETAALPEFVRRHLPLGDAASVGSLAELNDRTEKRHLPHFRALAERIREADRAVVESYSDIARPIRNVEFDAVAVVEPRRVRAYDGERFDKACDVADGSPRDGALEERVEDVVDLLDPAAVESLPPLSDAERSDPAAVASAYENAYEALLSV
ncbi:ATPase [Halomicrococcus sp. SG-WS-1]|uniref:ATPase n=1 Tax=Halomicrococcus sp. SG-WS-1 TaxID=3439057 RepID=UPI003F79A896